MTHYYSQLFIDYLHQHPHWGGLIACLIAFAESFPVLGSIVPGTITMTAVGAAMGAGILPITPTLLWTLCGAIAGDSSGYLLGRYFQDRVSKIWPFTRHPHLLASGRNFFAKHGGKSIFMGFYMGPIRSMVPLTAGMLNLSALRFFSAILPSACVWASLYTFPGFMLGRFSLTLPPKLATEFIFFVLLSIVLLWLLIWCINHVFGKIWAVIDHLFYILWTYLQRQEWFHPLDLLLRDKTNPTAHYQLLRLFFIVLLFTLFTLTLCNVIAKGTLTNFNEPIYFLLRSLRNHITTPVMIAISLFSDKRVMWVTTALVAVWLMRKKYFRTAFYLIGLSLTTTATILFFKHEIPSIRPPEPNYPVSTNSLPSGHTTLSIALLIFFAALIASTLPAKHKKIPFYCTSFVIVLIAISRLYLGAHWLSDIIASLLLAIAFALTALLLYFREDRPRIPAIKLLSVILLSLIISWASNSIYAYRSLAQIYAHPDLATIAVDNSQWWTRTEQSTPLYREDRFGHPVQTFNVQWTESLQDIKTTLTAQGWQDHSSDANFSSTISAIANKSPLRYLSLFPKLYQNRPAAALLSFGTQKPFLVLQLWEGNIILNDNRLKNNAPLWLGSIYYYPLPHTHETKTSANNNYVLNPTQSLLPFLKNYHTKRISIPKLRQPASIQKTNWDGHILLIKPEV